MRRFSNKNKRIRPRNKRNKRRRSKKKRVRKKLLRKRSRKRSKDRRKIRKHVKFARRTKAPNWDGHKESRLMTQKQKKYYLSRCVKDPFRFLS